MAGQRGPGLGSHAGQHVDNPRRQAALERDLPQPHRRHRRLFGGLQHDGAAGGDRRGDPARADLDRVVPRDDLSRHADRLADGVVEETGAERDRVAHDLVGDAGEELEVARGHLHVGARLPQRLPVVAALEHRKVLRPVAQRLRDADHDPSALGRRGAAPGLRVERRMRGLDGAVDVGLRRLGHGGERPAGRGVADLEGPAVGRVDALSVHNQLLGHGHPRTARNVAP